MLFTTKKNKNKYNTNISVDFSFAAVKIPEITNDTVILYPLMSLVNPPHLFSHSDALSVQDSVLLLCNRRSFVVLQLHWRNRQEKQNINHTTAVQLQHPCRVKACESKTVPAVTQLFQYFVKYQQCHLSQWLSGEAICRCMCCVHLILCQH